MKPVLYIVVPCYNEEEVLPVTSEIFLKKLDELAKKEKISENSRILFVNDGSTDSTWEIICSLAEKDSRFLGISQSRNRGHQSSLLAGLMEAKDKCNITISIDADGQDDVDAMDEMIDAYTDGCDIVYGVRSNRESDSFFKRSTAQTFYKLMNAMGAEIVYNHADYRLLSSAVLKKLEEFREVNLFLRGIIPMVGFKSTSVSYKRSERIAGKTHYSLRKMVGLAVDGITSFSIKPIQIITNLGVLISLLSFVGVIWSVVQYLRNVTVSGWASMTCIICFIGGIQLISIGILGEYIGKIYLETKQRPRYIINKKTYDDK
ncbi:MAG: glycosyltransferase family 2 protein [Oscillospiraceae bacterium]|nr:glycosyltransferase family 2 protein [Oscillospiraceae bacterium]